MVSIEYTEVFGWSAAVRGMRNAMNSWEMSDSRYGTMVDPNGNETSSYWLGPNDLTLMEKLVKAGPDHRKFMRFIIVQFDITAPLYWWKEYDTYKVGTVANSCSTMHKIHAKEFTEQDFSNEHLYTPYDDKDVGSSEVFTYILTALNRYRKRYLESKSKQDWWQMIQLLPTSYNQRRTLQLSYEVLRNIYHARKNHKLDEWHTFCKWIESLPYSELITLD